MALCFLFFLIQRFCHNRVDHVYQWLKKMFFHKYDYYPPWSWCYVIEGETIKFHFNSFYDKRTQMIFKTNIDTYCKCIRSLFLLLTLLSPMSLKLYQLYVYVKSKIEINSADAKIILLIVCSLFFFLIIPTQLTVSD